MDPAAICRATRISISLTAGLRRANRSHLTENALNSFLALRMVPVDLTPDDGRRVGVGNRVLLLLVFHRLFNKLGKGFLFRAEHACSPGFVGFTLRLLVLIRGFQSSAIWNFMRHADKTHLVAFTLFRRGPKFLDRGLSCLNELTHGTHLVHLGTRAIVRNARPPLGTRAGGPIHTWNCKFDFRHASKNSGCFEAIEAHVSYAMTA